MSRKPWPMKWIVLAIVLFIVPYSLLTLRFRKPASFQPYEDAKERRHIALAGYSRISCRITRPSDKPIGAPAKISDSPEKGGIPAVLAAELIDKPVIPERIESVRAAEDFDGGQPYTVRFTCQPPHDRNCEFSAAHIYRKDRNLIVVVEYAPVADGLVQRVPADEAIVTAPAGTIDPGKYQVTLVGTWQSRSWPLQVH